MSADPAPSRATWDDLLDVAEGYVGEIIAGELVVSPRPAPAHAEATAGLTVLIGGPFGFGIGGPGGWGILDEPRIAFGEDIRVPDMAGWRTDRYEAPEQGPYTVVPDWICEALSPSTARTDRLEKLPLYARAGVGHVWLVDPRLRTVEVFRRQDERWLLLGTHAAPERMRAEPFDAVEIDLGLLWREPPAP